MFLPIGCCNSSEDGGGSWRRHQERKLRMLSYWRDAIERQLSAVNAAISTLERQMERDRPESRA